MMEGLDERLYEHPNFVWLDKLAVKEILDRRRPNNCEPITILNNLLRWSLYQVGAFWEKVTLPNGSLHDPMNPLMG